MIQVRNGPKLGTEQREQIRALIRREVARNPKVAASAVQRKMEEELGITLNAATFHKIYWHKVLAESSVQASGNGGGSVSPLPENAETAAPGVATQVEAELQPAECLTLSPGAGGKWQVRVEVELSRAAALGLMQAVIAVLSEAD